MSADKEKVCFAQIDGHLDSNPKIVKAGSVFATSIFEFLLRRVAIGNTNGTVPIAYIDPDYLSRTLFMSCDEARHGTSRAVTANLIQIDEAAGVVFVVGWTSEWGRRPKSGGERTASWRERQKQKVPESHDSDVTFSRHTSSQASHVTVGDESDAREEKRREEIEDMSGKPDAPVLVLETPADSRAARQSDANEARAVEFAGIAIGEINRIARKSYEPTSKAVLRLCRALVKAKHTPEEAVAIIGGKRAWLGDSHMKQFFRPATLLALENFENYLDELAANRKPIAPAQHRPTVDDDFEVMPVWTEKSP